MANTYPPELKARAVEIYRTKGATAAAKEVGVAKQSVSAWAKKAGVACEVTGRTKAASEALARRWELRRAEMIDEIGEAAELALTKTTEALRANQARPAQALATTMAILVDKAQLLNGQPTSRSEVVNGGSELDREIEGLMENMGRVGEGETPLASPGQRDDGAPTPT